MLNNIYEYRILIIDFGSQYTQLIAKRIREMGIYCKVLPYNVNEYNINKFNPHGIILSGSPESANIPNSPRAPNCIFDIGIPVMGICYGMQIMVLQLGGQVISVKKREFGYTQIEIIHSISLIKNIKYHSNTFSNQKLGVWMSHGDQVSSIPDDFIVVARTKDCPFALIANEKKHFYGLQFHPEVTHTSCGLDILKNFIFNICLCKSSWIPNQIVQHLIKKIQTKIGKSKVILGLSGGVDSSVTAMLLHLAIGNQLTCIFIDNGFLRLKEAEEVMSIFNNLFNLNIIYVHAEKRFFTALKGVNDPEEKRKIIGSTFIDVFNEEANKLNNIRWLAQGTIYSDVIESAISLISGKKNVIKSHHNVGGLPKNMNLNLIEPIRKLFKDEVRKIGLELGLPYEILFRHPFPGPGLAIRILGETTKEYCDLLRKTDAIFLEELQKYNLYNKLSQAFTVFLPIRSVSVKGDVRKYDWVISLRAVETIDFMTADWAKLPYDLLSAVSNRIINEVHGISRVVYDISSKPPATIEWE
ncbi:GMP synthase (glutamine-hydrolyzing) [Candidatus Pantoea edessiphila]|uniref:GMP synthase [glutamine-hydrolyzing] n=1 Tax=Candidatus Pantoea edessiphila TaxID=2044610 RepID=A0A2P5SYI1_9GAMM|nr:glutamine-hydrolyzing GMP synthase [Candidatus Pantoea edessiphila]MBK4775510.1 glutamine-hydrolyzing GMP synthase [Pantoea sp. Edef]PPI87362.1 GMP synthase (glutamine-hydrolyzing) [Candidatus Pantoea edessiphila]